MGQVLRTKEMQKYLGISSGGLYQLIYQGLPCYRENPLQTLLFDTDAVDEWMKEREKKKEGLLSVKEASEYLRVPVSHIYNWLHDGLPCTRINITGPIYIKKTDLDNLKTWNTTEEEKQ